MIWSWLVARIITPFLPWILGGLVAAGLAGSLAAYLKGRADASASCLEAALKEDLQARELVIERYKTLLRANELQRVSEAARALDTAAAMSERLAELEAERAQAEASQKDVEQDLAAAIQDKGKLDAIVQKLRAAPPPGCRATDADVRLDGRLRGAR